MHFSLYGFLRMIYHLLFILNLFQTVEMILERRQFRAIFLFEFKMDCKAVETAHNINNASDPGTANKHTVQWWFRKFCKGEDSVEDEKHSGWSLEVDSNGEASSKLTLLQLHEKLQGRSAFGANCKGERDQ